MKALSSDKFANSLIISGVIAMVAITILFFLLSKDDLASYGDVIGGFVGSIWALAGVILFYSALKSQQAALEDQRVSTKATIDAVNKQSEALELQMKEFELQRKELEETRKVFQEQSDTLNVQRFEGSFFHLLTLKKNLLDQISAPDGKGHSVYGPDAYSKLWNDFEILAKNSHIGMDATVIRRSLVSFVRDYHANTLEPYFSLLFYTLNILYKTEISNKDDYASIFVSQLTETDKLFLFYYGAIDSPGNQLKPLLENFAVLRFLNEDRLIDRQHSRAYSTSAFVPEKY